MANKSKPRTRQPVPRQPLVTERPVGRLPTPRRDAEASILAILVLLSGCAALAMQVAWMRELRLVFGSTTASVAAVLAIFMGGLGLGSALLGRRADRAANPLAMYGWLEIGIAVSAALSPLWIGWAANVYWGLGGQTALGMTGATAARLVLAAAVLALPTFLMGGTLPAIVRAVTGATDVRRRGLGLLYGANTVGAVVGCAAATFYALEQFGTRATLWAGATVGLLAGSLALIKSRQVRLFADESESESTASTFSPDSGQPAAPAWLIYTAAGVVGFAFFALEIVWYRMLAPILGGTTYTFGLILSLALLGIGLGGLLYPLLARWWRPSLGMLALTCAAEALFAMIPFAIGDPLAIWAGWESQNATSFGGMVWGWTQIAAVVVFPVALISGIQFPLLIALLGQGRAAVSRHVGTAYAWNTLGAISGSLAAGFGAMPLLGTLGLWCAVAWVLLGLSLLVVVVGPVRRPLPVAMACLMILGTLACQFAPGPTAVWRHSAIGARRTFVPEGDANLLRYWAHRQRRALQWEADGRESSIGLISLDGLAFVVNGKSDGNAIVDAPTQIGMAILAAVLHPDPRTGLVIGLGTGETTGWLAEMREMERVDVVEIEPAIDEMARRCGPLNRNVLENPRVRRWYMDAREYMLAARETYDVIVSEPSNPYRAGIATLYTQEFYRAVHRRLNDDGVFVQFVQAYEVDLATVDIVLTTIRSVFPHVEVWQTGSSDMQLVCYKRPVNHNLRQLQERIDSPVVREAMQLAWHVDDVNGFLAHFVLARELTDEIHEQPVKTLNTDDCTVLEYRFAKTVGVMDLFTLEALREGAARRGRHLPTLDGEAPDWAAIELLRQTLNLLHRNVLSVALLPNEDDRALVAALHEYRARRYEEALTLWPTAHRESPLELHRWILAHCHAELGQAEFLASIEPLAARRPAEAASLRGVYEWRSGRGAAAAEHIQQVLEHLQQDPWVLSQFAVPGLQLAREVARDAPDVAQGWLPYLAPPFAAWRFERQRSLLRVAVAETTGHSDALAAVLEWEPNPEWTQASLETRARIYAAAKHPWADRAQRDLELFLRQAKPVADSNAAAIELDE